MKNLKVISNIILILVGLLCMATCDENDDASNEFHHLCENKDDVTACARDYFAKHGRCTIVRSPNDKPVYRERHNAYMPKINLTIVTTKVHLSNLNGIIERFYINKKTNNLVMTINFEGIVLDSPETYFYINQRGFEPKMLIERANGTYPAVLTAVIPTKDRITAQILKESGVTAYLPKGNVNFSIGPKVTESKDPLVAAVVKGLIADVPTAVQEIFLTESYNYFIAYLQKYICDFGIPLSSKPGDRPM